MHVLDIISYRVMEPADPFVAGSPLPGGAIPAPAQPNALSPAKSSSKTAMDDYKEKESKLPENSAPSEASIAAEVAGIDEIIEAAIEELSNEKSFHGSVPLEDILPLLKAEGDYLLRTADDGETKKEKEKIHISIFSDGAHKHLPFKIAKATEGDPTQHQVTLDGMHYKATIMELIKQHKDEKLPIELSSKLLLGKAVNRAPWELNKDRVDLGKVLGEGANGVVREGTLKLESRTLPIAIKVTKLSEENKSKVQEMMEEARLMRQLKHHNVVAFYGVVMDSKEAMIVMELVKGGGLDKFVQTHTNLTSEHKCSFLFDVACGLYYLHLCKFLHRDVACRNCLIDVITNIVKLSDFGMSKKGESYKVGAKERTPIRWQAPELLTRGLYTKECDVYSFGILCWEVLSGGKKPFSEFDIATIRKRVLEENFRPKIETSWPLEVQGLIKACFSGDPKRRPQMVECVNHLRKYCTRPGVAQPKPVEPARPGVPKSVKKTSAENEKSAQKSSAQRSSSMHSMKSSNRKKVGSKNRVGSAEEKTKKVRKNILRF